MVLSPCFKYWSIKNTTRLLIFHLIILLMYSNFGSAWIAVYDGNFNVEEFSDLELPFAESIPKNGVQGVVVAADPLHACMNISRPPDVNRTLNWFVLISGNLCDYETKIVYSKLAGYSTAIIYSYRGKDEHPYGKYFAHIPHYSNISAVLIRTISGLKIKERYLYTLDSKYRIFIYPNNTFNIMTFLLLFAIVAGLFLVIMLTFTIVRFVQQSHLVYRERLSSRHLRRLQTFRYRKGDQYETCAICLEDYKDRDKLRILPCSHGYHTKCIDPWLTNNRRICPVCKQKVILSGDFADAFNSDSEGRSETTPLLSSTERTVIHGTFNSIADSAASGSVPLCSNATASTNTECVPSTSILQEKECNNEEGAGKNSKFS